jgi:hypothetical protein
MTMEDMKNLLVVLLLLSSCSSYVASNKYTPHKINRTSSVSVKFDLLLDDDITVNDPRIKSIMYVSNNKSYVVIQYVNPNAAILAGKIATILTNNHVMVRKPILVNGESSLNKYAIVYVKYL